MTNTKDYKPLKESMLNPLNLLKLPKKLQLPKKLKHIFVILKLLGLSLTISSCLSLPRAPNTPLCLYDNYSIDTDGKDYSKSPVFHCSAANGTEFDIPWNSPSAKNMVGTPHDDYVKLNAYYKKIFRIFEKEYLNKMQ